ncbi:hypothetical protein [Pseudomonas sp. LP_7_YM]|uniref:hypothetical protein n=1 Tax=Pseudomonas sp. LP_7_YM TaxID=2485137 RepID=UPI00274014A0|nr:hypothetical protein [Pseudomonas sp. LP_7_YM]
MAITGNAQGLISAGVRLMSPSGTGGSASGIQEKHYRVKLRGAVISRLVISRLTVDSPHCVLQGDEVIQEHLEIRHRDIVWTHLAAGTSGYASSEQADSAVQ